MAEITGHKYPKWYSQALKKNCKDCGSELKPKRWQGNSRTFGELQSRFKKRQYCGSECRANALRKRAPGENYFYGKSLTPHNKGKFSGEGRYMYKTGYKRGYWRARDENGKWHLEHRLVAMRHLGLGENDPREVHHVDGDRGNNSPANLMVVTREEHYALHGKETRT